MKMYTLLLFCLITAASAAARQANSRLQQADSLLTTLYKPNAPGISIAILQNGQPVFKKSYGIADVDTKRSLTDTSCFNIGSLTKQFTAMGILLLEHSGRLSLDDKLSRWFPDMAKHVANTVTIRQLLTHTGGLIDHYDYTNTKNMLHAHDADVYAAIQHIDSTYFRPGTRFRYSNTGFCLLALIIERASRMPYGEYLQQNIFIPAGMLHTTVWGEHTNIPNATMGYDVDSATGSFTASGPEGHPFFSTEGDGGIYTTVNDYLKWFGALQGSKLLPTAIINEARSLHFTIDTPAHAGYGYGWFVDAGTPPLKVYHSGSNGGYRAYSFTIPADGYLILILSNRGDIDLEHVVEKINRMMLGEKGKFTGVERMVD